MRVVYVKFYMYVRIMCTYFACKPAILHAFYMYEGAVAHVASTVHCSLLPQLDLDSCYGVFTFELASVYSYFNWRSIEFRASKQYFPVVLFSYVVQGDSNFWVCGWNPKVWPFKWKLLSSTFLWCFFVCCTRWF